MTDKKPKISIVTCVWNLYKENRVETFRQTMESVHNQTYDNIEHIVINNNSNDGTDKLIAEYVDKGWATCFFHPVQGIWNAMNKGVEVATGDYINFMNSDDFYVSERSVEIAMNAIIKNGVEFVYAEANRLFEDGRIGRWYLPDHNLIFMGSCPCHQTLFLSMNVIREYGGFDLTFPLCCDDRMFLRLLAEKRKFICIPKPLANFRQGGFSSHQDGYQREYAQNFLNKFGQYWGMTYEDCLSLYLGHTFADKSIKYNRELAKKIKNKEWRISFEKSYKDYLKSLTQTTLYLFGRIPLLKKRHENQGSCLYLFGCIPIIKKNKT